MKDYVGDTVSEIAQIKQFYNNVTILCRLSLIPGLLGGLIDSETSDSEVFKYSNTSLFWASSSLLNYFVQKPLYYHYPALRSVWEFLQEKGLLDGESAELNFQLAAKNPSPNMLDVALREFAGDLLSGEDMQTNYELIARSNAPIEYIEVFLKPKERPFAYRDAKKNHACIAEAYHPKQTCDALTKAYTAGVLGYELVLTQDAPSLKPGMIYVNLDSHCFGMLDSNGGAIEQSLGDDIDTIDLRCQTDSDFYLDILKKDILAHTAKNHAVLSLSNQDVLWNRKHIDESEDIPATVARMIASPRQQPHRGLGVFGGVQYTPLLPPALSRDVSDSEEYCVVDSNACTS